ncbi:MAG: hypothetical protein HYV33_00965 [Candidatus Kerfeldbacteria bacterium]|nr:hypothetical protein [Candidatus Kerfeldbacteria bacterium]
MNWRSFSRTCLLFLAFFIFVLVPSAQAQNSGYVEQIAYQLEQPIGGVSKIQNAALPWC